MKIGYFGSPDISARLLTTLLELGQHEILFVVSNPDRPRGRSGAAQPTEVSKVAIQAGIPLHRFEKWKTAEPGEILQAAGADLFLVFAYGRILPVPILEIPPLGSVNLHASHLPLLRGASPIQSAILQGLNTTGWTLQKMAQEMDAGDIISLSAPIPVEAQDTAGSLKEKLMDSGMDLVLQFLENPQGALGQAYPQNAAGATYCTKLKSEDSWLEWNQPAADIHRRVMGMNPSPMARTRLGKLILRILRTKLDISPSDLFLQENREASPGRLLIERNGKRKKLLVATQTGFLEIVELQPENRKAMSAGDFLNGFRLEGDAILASED